MRVRISQSPDCISRSHTFFIWCREERYDKISLLFIIFQNLHRLQLRKRLKVQSAASNRVFFSWPYSVCFKECTVRRSFVRTIPSFFSLLLMTEGKGGITDHHAKKLFWVTFSWPELCYAMRTWTQRTNRAFFTHPHKELLSRICRT